MGQPVEQEISPRKAEYIRYILEAGGSVKTTELARRFDVSTSTGSRVIRELAEAGLIMHTPYSRADLTPEGRNIALFIQRRHRILALLFSHYGFTPDEACDAVHTFESYVSRESVNRICASLGHPVMSVCGKIIHETGCCLRPDK